MIPKPKSGKRRSVKVVSAAVQGDDFAVPKPRSSRSRSSRSSKSASTAASSTSSSLNSSDIDGGVSLLGGQTVEQVRTRVATAMKVRATARKVAEMTASARLQQRSSSRTRSNRKSSSSAKDDDGDERDDLPSRNLASEQAGSVASSEWNALDDELEKEMDAMAQSRKSSRRGSKKGTPTKRATPARRSSKRLSAKKVTAAVQLEESDEESPVSGKGAVDTSRVRGSATRRQRSSRVASRAFMEHSSPAGDVSVKTSTSDPDHGSGHEEPVMPRVMALLLLLLGVIWAVSALSGRESPIENLQRDLTSLVQRIWQQCTSDVERFSAAALEAAQEWRHEINRRATPVPTGN